MITMSYFNTLNVDKPNFNKSYLKYNIPLCIYILDLFLHNFKVLFHLINLNNMFG